MRICSSKHLVCGPSLSWPQDDTAASPTHSVGLWGETGPSGGADAEERPI